MIEALLDRFGDGIVLTVAGLLVGILFGAAAQHSRFCLRAATIEVADGQLGPRLAIWLVAFSAAVFCVQAATTVGVLDASQSRQIAAAGSLSGAIIGGLMFGSGMIFARGCASRLLVLSATGNLRALVTGLVLTLVAQASLRGVLAPLREALATLWMIPGGSARDLLALINVSSFAAALLAVGGILASALLASHQKVPAGRILSSALVGAAVGAGWLATYAVAQASFELVPVSSITFTGPSTDTLMGLINQTSLPLGFGFGLVPGVFAGAAFSAVFAGEWRIERFGQDTPMERYMVGAILMGFGSMLAGGCAVGAGMSGGAVFSLTAWVAVGAMWAGAMATHRLMSRRTRQIAV